MHTTTSCRSIPREEIPPRIGDMEITPALLDDYKDHGASDACSSDPAADAHLLQYGAACAPLPATVDACGGGGGGAEILLKFRARHSEGCRKAFDAMRLCILGERAMDGLSACHPIPWAEGEGREGRGGMR